jgi:heme-degrading monooxygenase HmoA
MPAQLATDHEELTVLLEFDVEPEEQEPLRQALDWAIPEVLDRQPGLIAAHVLVSRDGRKVLTYLVWTSLDAFEAFRDDEAEQRRIRAVLGPYGPRLRVYDVVLAAVGPGSSSAQPGPTR